MMKQGEEVKKEFYEEDSEQDGTGDRNQAKLQGSGGEWGGFSIEIL